MSVISTKSAIGSFFDKEVAEHVRELEEIKERAEDSFYSSRIQRRVDGSINDMEKKCEALEESLAGENPEELKEAKKEFRDRIKPYFDQSFFMKRGKEKPKGYPGDYVTLEGIYNSEGSINSAPSSTGIGLYLDSHFLNSRLARAIINRKNVVRSFIEEELNARGGELSVLNIASGSAREWAELLGNGKGLENVDLTCLDLDKDALDACKYTVGRKGSAGPEINLLQENVVKLALKYDRNPEEVEDKLGKHDLIYSVGLYDYVNDKFLEKILNMQSGLVKEEGKMLLAFKDRSNYNPTKYDWCEDWQFVPRTGEDSRGVIEQIGVKGENSRTFYEPSGTIVFFEFLNNDYE